MKSTLNCHNWEFHQKCRFGICKEDSKYFHLLHRPSKLKMDFRLQITSYNTKQLTFSFPLIIR